MSHPLLAPVLRVPAEVPEEVRNGFDPSNPDDWFEWFVGVPLRVLLIIGIGAIALALVRRVIRRITEHIAEGTPTLRSKRLQGVADSGVGSVLLRANPLASARRAQRARTVGSVLRSVANILIGATIVLLVLTELGVNIAPFLASAGIAGVALGFGAQSLVKDFLSGTFMLLEDQYGVGDVVDLGDASGTVEAVGLRVTRLRDVSGTVWYVRNGEVLRVGNLSQNWARSVLDITVGYESDLDQVQSILREVAHQLYADPAFAGLVLDEPEVPGVERFDKDGPVVRVLIKTAPLKQWEVSRAMRQRIKARFDAAGIRIPATVTAPMPSEEG